MKKYLPLLLLLVATVLFAVTYPFSNTMTGIVYGWHFDENTGTATNDVVVVSSSNINNAAWTTTHTGFTAELTFDGNGDSVDSGILTRMPSGNTNFALGFWYYTGVSSSIVYVFNCNSPLVYTLGNKWIVNCDEECNFTNSSVRDNTWTHIIFTRDTAKHASLYQNGELVQTVTTAGNTNVHFDGNWIMGNISAAGGSGWNGKLDDVVLTNTYVDATAAAAWYNGDVPSSPQRKIRRMGFSGVIE